jgi:Cu(I)/Ag(I) efflux system membrane fusion protein
MQGCAMSGMTPTTQPAAQPPDATAPLFDQPVQAVFDNYIKAQAALVQDSLAGVTHAGSVMTKASSGAASKSLPPAVTSQAESLAKAKDLESARAAFKLLSNSLIEFANAHNATGTYHIAYCPVAKASWLQTGTTVLNPYFGKAMPHCGQLKT